MESLNFNQTERTRFMHEPLHEQLSEIGEVKRSVTGESVAKGCFRAVASATLEGLHLIG